MLNLLQDRCFPIIRADGRVDRLRFAEIASRDNPAVDFWAPRGDLAAAMVQLGIGLLQTAFAPEESRAWMRFYEHPPAPEELRERLAPAREAFELMGDGPRFMQDLTLADTDAEPKPIATLLIEQPGGNTLRNNLDHFVKRDTVCRLAPFWAAISLFCLQTNAPSGGVGHRTSLRGGGPLSSLVKGPTLWQTLWLGVLETRNFYGDDHERWRDATNRDIFPWLSPTRTSEKKGAEIRPEEAHPLTCYWAMPRRIRLLPPSEGEGVCDLSGEVHDRVFESFITKNYGNNYAEGWLHPLTPHYEDKEGLLLPRHGQPGQLAYRHWLGLLFEVAEKKAVLPARVVTAFAGLRRDKILARTGSNGAERRLWVFGYDMDNMKARSWIDATLPIILPAMDRDVHGLAYRRTVRHMIQVSELVARQCLRAFKTATIRAGAKARGDFSFVTQPFWQKTENEFYRLARLLTTDPDDEALREGWLKFLFRMALDHFDHLLRSRPVESVDPERVARARGELIKFTSFRGKKMRAMLDLAPLAKTD